MSEMRGISLWNLCDGHRRSQPAGQAQLQVQVVDDRDAGEQGEALTQVFVRQRVNLNKMIKDKSTVLRCLHFYMSYNHATNKLLEAQ